MDLYIYYKVKDADAASLQAALSAMQAVKLKEIAAKAKGEPKQLKRKPFRRKGGEQ